MAAAAGSVVSPYGMSPVAIEHALHPLPADHAARQLGSTQPIARTGNASTVNRNATLTTSSMSDRALTQPEHADHEHGERAEAGQGVEHRVEHAAQPADADHRVAQLGGPGGEPVGLLVLATHGLDHERAVEALVGDRARLGPQRLRPRDARRHQRASTRR